jgi:UPF0755 protein
MWRSLASNALTLFIVLLAGIAGLVAWGEKTYTGPGPLAQAVCVRVDKGASVASISKVLLGQGAISNGILFRLGAQYSGQPEGLKFGSYLVRPGTSMAEIFATLTKGGQSSCGTEVNFRVGVTDAQIVVRTLDPATEAFVEVAKFDVGTLPVPQAYVDAEMVPDTRYRVTLAEGVTSWQVVDSLKKADFLTGDVAKVPEEGSLAPESYDVTRGEPRVQLIAEMQARQAATLAELWGGRAAGLPYKTPGEAMVMASLIEKETGVASERPLVASVFLNRLAQGIKLQTDPAVIYGITKGQGTLGRGLRQSELRAIANPYNTYVIDGLPPGPIANPGRASIAAALHPADTRDLYFVADGTGGHAFAETLAEHNKNVAKWRAIEAAQGIAPDAGN